MIGQLVRTRFESNLMSFIVFVALIAYAAVRYAMAPEASDVVPPPGGRRIFVAAVVMAYAWLMMICLVPGAISLLRQSRERSGRLYAHLPVTARQNRVAYWLHVGLYPGIAASILLVYVALAGSGATWEYLMPLMFIFHSGVLLACFSLATSNLSRIIPGFVRRNVILYCIVVAMATFLLMAFVAFAVMTMVGRFEGPESWPKLGTGVGIACVALVALDIHLYGKKDHNLG